MRVLIPENNSDKPTDLTFPCLPLGLLEAVGRAIYTAVNNSKAHAALQANPKQYFAQESKDGEGNIPPAAADIPKMLDGFDLSVVSDSLVTTGDPDTDDFKVVSGTLNVIIPARTRKLEDMSDPAEQSLYLRELGLQMLCGCGFPRRPCE